MHTLIRAQRRALARPRALRATNGESCSRFSRTSAVRIDRAAIRRIVQHDRDWRRTSVGHKKIMIGIEMVMPVLSSNGIQTLVIDRNKKIQMKDRKNGRVARGLKTMYQHRS